MKPRYGRDGPGSHGGGTLPTDAERVQQLRDLLAARGGLAVLRQDCATVTSYNSQNHLPLLWPCFQSHRAVLFANSAHPDAEFHHPGPGALPSGELHSWRISTSAAPGCRLAST